MSEIRDPAVVLSGGKKLFCVVHRPFNENLRALPAVLFCGGYGGNKSGRCSMFVHLAQALAETGMVVLRFDYRGHGDSEGLFSEVTIEGEVEDAVRCFEWLCKHPQVDRERVGVLGRSLGGAIALMLAERVRAVKSVVLWAPLFSAAPWQSALGDREFPHLMREPPSQVFVQQFFNIDMTTTLSRLTTLPLLHLCGAQDSVLTPFHTEHYAACRSGVPRSKFVTLLHSGHEFGNEEDFKLATQETIAWFRDTLKSSGGA